VDFVWFVNSGNAQTVLGPICSSRCATSDGSWNPVRGLNEFENGKTYLPEFGNAIFAIYHYEARTALQFHVVFARCQVAAGNRYSRKQPIHLQSRSVQLAKRQ
jgi:hypothetical protein